MTVEFACAASLLFVLASPTLTAQTQIGPTENGAPAYDIQKEAALGKGLAAEFRRQTTMIGSPAIQKYLDRLGQRLAAKMTHVRSPFIFSTVVNDPCPITHEPTALPGGYVFVPSSLFLEAYDEDEFAGMLAHSMEHIAQRHGSRAVGRGTVGNNSNIPLIFIGGWSNCSSALIPLRSRASSTNNELEADTLAIQIIARAGFDPGALVRYIERVQILPAGSISNRYSMLPDRDQRVAGMLLAIEQLVEVDHASGPSDEFATAREEVRRQVRALSEPRSNGEPPRLARPNQAQ